MGGSSTSAREYARLVWYGLLFVMIAGPVSVLVADATKILPGPRIHRFSLPSADVPFTLMPSLTLGSEGALAAYLQELIYGLIYLAALGVYYGSLLLLLVGLFLVFAGLLGLAPNWDLDAAMESFRHTSVRSHLPKLVVGPILVLTLIASPWARRAFLEFLVVVIVGGSMFGVLGVATVAVYDRFGPVFNILVVYPLLFATILLPIVAAALASPTFSMLVREYSTFVAIWILDNVLAVGGLDRPLRASFDLRGSAYVAMWFGIIAVVGWVIGLAVLVRNRVDLSIPARSLRRRE